MLYEVAIIERPTQKEVEEQGAAERLILAPTPVVAKDKQGAAIAASIEAELDELTPQMEVLVRPFN